MAARMPARADAVYNARLDETGRRHEFGESDFHDPRGQPDSPPELVSFLKKQQNQEPYDSAPTEVLRRSVAEVVKGQATLASHRQRRGVRQVDQLVALHPGADSGFEEA